MHFDEKTNEYTLSTGRRFLAVEGAISPRDNGDLFQGFDGWLHEDIDAPLTDAERREIADFMIAAWRGWAAADTVSNAAALTKEEVDDIKSENAQLEGVITRAWAALGVDPAEAADDPDTADLADSIKVSLQHERNEREQMAELHRAEKRTARRGQQRESAEVFHGGMIAALAVVRAHDAETIWREIVATEKGVTETARKSAEDWEWGGFAKYVGKRSKSGAKT